MGEDLSTGVKIAIVIIILCAIVAIVFTIMTISKNLTSKSTNELQDTLGAFQKLRWTDYDLKPVTGNEVQVLIRTAVDYDIAVVVNTSRLASTSVLYGAVLDGFTKNAAHNFYEHVATPRYTQATATGDLRWDDISSKFIGAYTYDSSTGLRTNLYGTYVKYINDKSSTYYIDPKLKFNSYLIKDASDTMIGVFFDQQGA